MYKVHLFFTNFVIPTTLRGRVLFLGAVAVATRYIELGNRYHAPWRSLAYNCRGVAHLWCNAFDAATADFERCVDLRLETLSHFGLEPAAAL